MEQNDNLVDTEQSPSWYLAYKNWQMYLELRVNRNNKNYPNFKEILQRRDVWAKTGMDSSCIKRIHSWHTCTFLSICNKYILWSDKFQKASFFWLDTITSKMSALLTAYNWVNKILACGFWILVPMLNY